MTTPNKNLEIKIVIAAPIYEYAEIKGYEINIPINEHTNVIFLNILSSRWIIRYVTPYVLDITRNIIDIDNIRNTTIDSENSGESKILIRNGANMKITSEANTVMDIFIFA